MIDHLEKNKRFAVIFTFLIAIEIFVISAIPGGKLSKTSFDLSHLYHMIVFFLLNFFFILSISQKKKVTFKYIALSIIFSLSYAILDEIHQIFIPYRFPSLTDVFVDFTGVLLSIIVYLYYKKTPQSLKI